MLRLGTCKRDATKLAPDLHLFDRHVARFIDAMPRFSAWRVEKVAFAPRHTNESRSAVQQRGYIAQDLVDLTRGL